MSNSRALRVHFCIRSLRNRCDFCMLFISCTVSDFTEALSHYFIVQYFVRCAHARVVLRRERGSVLTLSLVLRSSYTFSHILKPHTFSPRTPRPYNYALYFLYTLYTFPYTLALLPSILLFVHAPISNRISNIANHLRASHTLVPILTIRMATSPHFLSLAFSPSLESAAVGLGLLLSFACLVHFISCFHSCLFLVSFCHCDSH